MPFHPHCGICFEAYNENCVLVAMQCGHAYHQNCLLKWFEQRSVCPKCNYREELPFFRRQLIHIYLDGQTDNDVSRYDYRTETDENNVPDDEWPDIDWPYLLRTYIVPIFAILIAIFIFAMVLGGSYAEAELKRLAANERYYVAEIKKLQAQIDRMKVDKNSSVLPLCFFVLIAGIGVGRFMVEWNIPAN